MSKGLVALSIVLGVAAAYFGANWWLGQQALAGKTAELYQTETELTTTQEALSASESSLADNRGQLDRLRTELAESQDSLMSARTELALAGEQLASRETELATAEARLTAMDAGMFHLYDPTLEEALDFMAEDRTDTHEYIEGEYVCSHFAADVNKNAEEEGLRCAFVDIRFPDSAHAIIAFDSVDKGLVYFDPITDERVRPAIGKHYWKCIEPKPGYVYQEPDFDDTIEDIVVIW